MRVRIGAHWWVLLALGAVFGLVGALGGFLPRDDPGVAVVQAGDVVELDLATVVVDSVSADANGVTLDVTITSHVHVPLEIDHLLEVVDDVDRLAIAPVESTVGAGYATVAQPGLPTTFHLRFDYDRQPVGAVRITLIDGTFVSRDDTTFGLFDNVHDQETVAILEVSP